MDFRRSFWRKWWNGTHSKLMETKISKDIWEKWPSRFKANFFNSLGGLKCVGLLSTMNSNGIANSGVFSQVIHIGSSPPTWGFLFRPPTIAHQSYENLMRNSYFNFSLATEFISLEILHQCSANYSNEISELDIHNIKWNLDKQFNVPILLNADIQFIFKKIGSHSMSNGTLLVEAEVIEVISNVSPEKDGFMNISEKKIISSQGLNAYAETNSIRRFDYANP